MTVKMSITVLFFCLFFSCHQQNSELVLLGTVHSPVENFNADSLYQILEKIKPDIILYEVDSSFFDKAFNFQKDLNSNEYFATSRYLKNSRAVIRPYDFTGRNEYRINAGSRPADSKTLKMLDSLYGEKLLDQAQSQVYKEYMRLTETLNSFAYKGAKAFNNPRTDSIAALRQFYQYEKLLELVRSNAVFGETHVEKPDGERISYREGYQLASGFWHMRNQAMAKHILQMLEEFRGKRIVVLNGYFHRYYLITQLKPKQEAHSFQIKEFYEY